MKKSSGKTRFRQHHFVFGFMPGALTSALTLEGWEVAVQTVKARTQLIAQQQVEIERLEISNRRSSNNWPSWPPQ